MQGRPRQRLSLDTLILRTPHPAARKLGTKCCLLENQPGSAKNAGRVAWGRLSSGGFIHFLRGALAGFERAFHGAGQP